MQARDLALETFLHKTQLKISDSLRGALRDVLASIALKYRHMPNTGYYTSTSQAILDDLNDTIDHIFERIVPNIRDSILLLRKHAYLLSRVGEVEALSRTRGSGFNSGVTPIELNNVSHSHLPGDEDLQERIRLALNRIRRSIVDTLDLARVQRLELNDVLTRVKAKFPPVVRYKRPPRVLKKPIKEADYIPVDELENPSVSVEVGKRSRSVSHGIIPENEWMGMVDEYLSDYIPVNRGSDYVFDVGQKADAEEWFAWEIEQQVTHDFVDKVRSGQVDAANKNGINDFVWISIIDNKTDECCVWRHSLTTSEIEAELKRSHKDDECQAITPPAHFFCRCTMSPMLKDMPEETPPDFGDFEQWLLT